MSFSFSKLISAVALTFAAGTAGMTFAHDHKGGTEDKANPKAEEKKAEKTIVEIAVADGRFTALVGAVTKAGLAETLSGPGPFTVFAPTDEAFAKLPKGTVEGLTKEQLTGVLTYHVLAGKFPAASVLPLDGKSVETVNGQSVAIKVVDGKVMVDGATVVIADIKASNGVIHVIDSVILPK